MRSIRISIIAGARPNFVKIAPIIHSIHKAQKEGAKIDYRLIHTGQHYDKKMSGDFFEQLQIPEPHMNLEAGGGTQAEQTANIMVRFEKELMENPCDAVLVVGDVTSTMACAITAQKLHTKVIHVESGIRSGDWKMPEEINRLVTDSITNIFFTTSQHANNNLLKSGVSENDIVFVGNTMIDTLLTQMPNFQKPEVWDELKLDNQKYLIMTLHRPSNVDDADQLNALISVIESHVSDYPVIFPVHPRTRNNMAKFGISLKNIHLIDPLSYLEFNYLVKYAKGVITDSGGITEETTVMNVPCLTLRDSTERPETCEIGTNELVGKDPNELAKYLDRLMKGNWKKGQIPKFWDGETSDRIVKSLLDRL